MEPSLVPSKLSSQYLLLLPRATHQAPTGDLALSGSALVTPVLDDSSAVHYHLIYIEITKYEVTNCGNQTFELAKLEYVCL